MTTRSDAKAGGLKRYWTGIECKNGHKALRFTSTGACMACLSAHRRVRRGKMQNAQAAGLVLVSVKAHRDDRAALEAYAAALVMARRLSG